MMPTLIKEQAPVPPPSYNRIQAKRSRDLHINALTLVTTLHLLALCRMAVRMAHRRCPPPLRGIVQVDIPAYIAKRVCYSSTSYGGCGACLIKICMIG